MDGIRSLSFALLALLLWTAGCTPEPEPIRYGEANCAYCRMTVADPRYGSELVTSTGKTFMFDSIECLAAYVQENPDVDVHSLWVPNFRDPGTLMNVENAFFVRSDQLKSPMSLNVAAFRQHSASPDAVADSLSGTVMAWEEVRTLVKREWIESPSGGPGGMRGAHRPHRHRGIDGGRPTARATDNGTDIAITRSLQSHGNHDGRKAANSDKDGRSPTAVGKVPEQ